MRGQTKCSRFFTRIFSMRWADDDWQQNRLRHQSPDHVQRGGIVTGGLTHARDVEGTEHIGETPGRKHQTINGSYFGPRWNWKSFRKLPTETITVQWVTVNRIRVKDSYTDIEFLSDEFSEKFVPIGFI